MQHGPRRGRDIRRFIVLAGEGPNMIEGIEDHDGYEFNLIIKLTS